MLLLPLPPPLSTSYLLPSQQELGIKAVAGLVVVVLVVAVLMFHEMPGYTRTLIIILGFLV